MTQTVDSNINSGIDASFFNTPLEQRSPANYNSSQAGQLEVVLAQIEAALTPALAAAMANEARHAQSQQQAPPEPQRPAAPPAQPVSTQTIPLEPAPPPPAANSHFILDFAAAYLTYQALTNSDTRSRLLPLIIAALAITRDHAPRRAVAAKTRFAGVIAMQTHGTDDGQGIGHDRVDGTDPDGPLNLYDIAADTLDDVLITTQDQISATIRAAAAFNASKLGRNANARDPEVNRSFAVAQDPTITPKQIAVAATRIARQVARETVFKAQQAIARQLGYSHQRWVTERDDRVRHSHDMLDGVTVPLGTDFQTANGTLRYPGDKRASMSEYINCRCSLEMIKRHISTTTDSGVENQ